MIELFTIDVLFLSVAMYLYVLIGIIVTRRAFKDATQEIQSPFIVPLLDGAYMLGLGAVGYFLIWPIFVVFDMVSWAGRTLFLRKQR